MIRRARLVLVLLAVAGCGASVSASHGDSSRQASASHRDSSHDASTSVRLVRIGSFSSPVYLTAPSGDRSRIFVLQRAGQVMLMHNGHKQSRPFLDVSKLVFTGGSDEQGLLGLAFSPDYAHDGLFYIDYTISNNDVRVVQYRRSRSNADVASPASAHVVLTIKHPFDNHNGGQLAFGPDGDLYIGVGDGGDEDDPRGYGQNTDVLLGKILRIDPSSAGAYTVPKSNPFVGESGRRPEIWAYGLRNPWRFSFDRLTGDLIIGDVGQDLEEEIDFVRAGTGAGSNYGWSIWEGDRRNKPGNAPHAVFPVLVGLHRDGYCAIIGGVVVRDRSLPSLYGRYLFGDNCRAQIESVKLSAAGAKGLRATRLSVNSTSSFGQDAAGRIYVVSLNGPVYRIQSG